MVRACIHKGNLWNRRWEKQSTKYLSTRYLVAMFSACFWATNAAEAISCDRVYKESSQFTSTKGKCLYRDSEASKGHAEVTRIMRCLGTSAAEFGTMSGPGTCSAVS